MRWGFIGTAVRILCMALLSGCAAGAEHESQ